MHRVFESHIRSILDQRKPKALLEIGVLRGDTTLRLLEWCSANGSHLTSLDPVTWEGELPEEVKQPWPGYKYKRGQEGFDDWVIVPTGLEEVFKRGLQSHWTCLKTRSLDFLDSPAFDGFDVYLIDGDHNYYTVSQELRLIHQRCRLGDMVLFDDVSGEWARRDMYYDLEFIPPEHIRGRKQGVLTAINDFLDSLGRKRLWMPKECPYTFKVLTKKRHHLGVMIRVA